MYQIVSIFILQVMAVHSTNHALTAVTMILKDRNSVQGSQPLAYISRSNVERFSCFW